MPRTLDFPARQKTVVLFGEVLVDVFPDKKVLGGAPFNVARHLWAFGLYPVLITRTGNDEVRDQLLDTMDRFGMDTKGVQIDHSYPSGRVNILIKGKQHKFEILADQAYDHIHAETAQMVAHAARPRLIYFGTLAQRSQTSRRAITAIIKNSKSPKMLDINLRQPWYDSQLVKKSLQRADIVKLNEEELAEIAGLLHLRGENSEDHAKALISKFELEQLSVTCGSQGAWQLTKNNKLYQSDSTKSVQTVDTVGAGDGFAAVQILGLLNKWSVEMTLFRANRFAAAICGIRGAIPQDQDFYIPFLEEWKTKPKARPLSTS